MDHTFFCICNNDNELSKMIAGVADATINAKEFDVTEVGAAKVDATEVDAIKKDAAESLHFISLKKFLVSLTFALFTSYAIQGKPPLEWKAGLIDVLPHVKDCMKSRLKGKWKYSNEWVDFKEKWEAFPASEFLPAKSSDPSFNKKDESKKDKVYSSKSSVGLCKEDGFTIPMLAYQAILTFGKNWNNLCEGIPPHKEDNDYNASLMAASWFGAMYGYEGVPLKDYHNYQDLLKPFLTRLFPTSCKRVSIDSKKGKTEQESTKTAHTQNQDEAESKIYVEPIINSKDLRLERYDMNYPMRGKAIIISNKTFSNGSERCGTEKDACALENSFKNLDFDVHSFTNLTANQMEEEMKKVAAMDHAKNDCFVCAVLSHGDDGYIWGIDKPISLDAIKKPFKDQQPNSLKEKPKIFFIQACRGSITDDGTDVYATCYLETDHAKPKLPIEADFLTVHSTVQGYCSWRDPKKGSWFIQSLCKVLNEHGNTMELIDMMTLVNHIVAKYYQSSENSDGKKQMPCIHSTLTKDVFFTSKQINK